MTRRIRLLMLVLAVVIVALGTGLIKLNLDTTQDTGDSKTTQPPAVRDITSFRTMTPDCMVCGMKTIVCWWMRNGILCLFPESRRCLFLAEQAVPCGTA